MLTLSTAELDALSSGDIRLGVFFRMDWDTGPIRLWLGIGDIKPGINVLDTTGATYNGLGELLGVPAVQQLINGAADRVTFNVSGVNQNTFALASTEAPMVKGQAVAMGIAIFDRRWQLLGAIKWIFRGRADVVNLNWQPGDNGIVRSLELSVGSLFTGRRRRGLSYLTDHDQQTRSPGDRYCERTTLYSNGVDKVWPRFS